MALLKTTRVVKAQVFGLPMHGDRAICAFAWASTDKWKDAFDETKTPISSVRRFIKFLLKGSGTFKPHASPFGHPHITFLCEAPLAVLGHVVRHRSFASFSVLSLRFTLWTLLSYMPEQGRRSVGKAGAYKTEPITGWRNWLGLFLMRVAYAISALLYLWLIRLGFSSELARFIAPEGRMTTWFMTFSLRNGLNFLVLRNEDHTMEETRELARIIEDAMRRYWPITFEVWEELGRPTV